MALDRQAIEKKDFPIGRRGYEPEAVDAHLNALADEIDELKRSSRRRTESLATAASEQVRSIVEAAESSASEIQRQAEDEARQIRQDATDDASRTRDDAAAQSRDHVSKVGESATTMVQRVDAMESELGALVESLRTGANRLTADLALLEGNMSELRESATGLPPGPEPVAEELEDDVADHAVDAEPDEAVEDFAAAEPDAALDGADGSEDTEGARLIALNMALNGTPRDETDRYLAENYGGLDDRDALLDEVYARVGS